jgi:hypothetical protein
MAVNATGKVKRLYVTYGASGRGLTFVRLEIPATEQPKESYFRLDQNHPNYNALYSLALSAAINGYRLRIRTEGEIVPTETPTVRYMVVDW